MVSEVGEWLPDYGKPSILNIDFNGLSIGNNLKIDSNGLITSNGLSIGNNLKIDSKGITTNGLSICENSSICPITPNGLTIGTSSTTRFEITSTGGIKQLIDNILSAPISIPTLVDMFTYDLNVLSGSQTQDVFKNPLRDDGSPVWNSDLMGVEPSLSHQQSRFEPENHSHRCTTDEFYTTESQLGSRT